MLVYVEFFLAFFVMVVRGTGPDLWDTVSEQCNGKAQSPINIITRKVLPDERLTSLQIAGHQETFQSNFMNNGHSVQLDLSSGIKVQGGNLATVYKAIQLHLHWGQEGGPGSGHTVDGERFPMEMHIVCIKEAYNSLSQAGNDSTDVSVHFSSFLSGSLLDNEKFNPVIDALQRIIFPGTNTTVSGLSLEMLILPQEMSLYFRYSGSLTTPDCSEAVIWTLFERPISLSRKQHAAFSSLQFSQGKEMVKTYRPVQLLNGRQVHYSGGSVSVVSGMLLISSVLVSILLSTQNNCIAKFSSIEFNFINTCKELVFLGLVKLNTFKVNSLSGID